MAKKKKLSEKVHDAVEQALHPGKKKSKRELPVGDIQGHSKFDKFKGEQK